MNIQNVGLWVDAIDESHVDLTEYYYFENVFTDEEIKLIQEEAMKVQKVALDRSTDRSFETLESLERMIISQGEQTTRVQEVLSMVLEKLALEPRQHINMRDSVLTQENNSTPAMTDDIMGLLG